MILATDIIEAVRDRHKSFDRESAPQGAILRFLSQAVLKLHGKIMEIDEDILRVEMNTAMPLADFSAGIALPENRTVVGITVQRTGNQPASFDIDLVPAALRNDRGTPAASAWQIGNKLYLRGDATDWKNYSSIAVSTIPVPPAVVASSASVDLPASALEPLADAVALQMAKRVELPLAPFVAAAADSESAFLDEIRNRTLGRSFTTRDVMHYFD